MTNKEAELYIHIPFSVRKCAYCDFLSFPAGEEIRKKYVGALLHEASASSAELKNTPVRSVFFGGGTPTVLDADSLYGILNHLARSFSILKNAEVTIECNPGTADEEKLASLKNAGFNRLSIGAQSFRDELLRKIGRIHSSRDIVSCFDSARKAGFDNINLDLICALPGQQKEDWHESLKKAAELNCEHISAYSLILEEGTPLWDQRDDLSFPDEEEERQMYEDTAVILSGFGYGQYEISNYAKPGRECIHNTGYWTGVPYKGLGLGASSYIGSVRYKNSDDLSEYIQNCEHPEKQYKEVQDLTDQDLMSEFVILGLRLTKGIATAEFEERFNKPLDAAFPGVCEKYLRMGLLKTKNGRLFFTRQGISVSNIVLSDFV